MPPFFNVLKIAVLLFFISQIVEGCFSFKMSSKQMNKEFSQVLMRPSVEKIKSADRKISYVVSGTKGKPTILFIHGSPGSWTAWKDFFKDSILLSNFQLVAVDRPGFGNSGLGNSEKSLKMQAAYLEPIFDRFKENKLYLVGHSYGGPVAVRSAIDYYDLVTGIILVAPSISPNHEKIFWVQHLGVWKATSWMLPASIRASNQEILPLKDELILMEKDLDKVKCKLIYIHGVKDPLVPVGNSDFAKQKLINAEALYWIEPTLNHFIPWTKPVLIKNAIFEISK